MGETSITNHDIVLLREILDLSGRQPGATSTDTAFELLERLEHLLGCDAVNCQDLFSAPGGDFSRTFVQAVGQGERGQIDGAELRAFDAEHSPAPLMEHWWQLPCSVVDRTRTACVVSTCDYMGVLEWKNHPGNTDYMQVADDILLAYPLPGGRTLRVLGMRESGRPFGLRERTLMELLLPHLQPLLERTQAEHGPDVPEGPAALTSLTRRQLEILQLAALGMPSRRVGRELGISEGTVRKHLENIYGRLGVQSRAEAIFWLHAEEAARAEHEAQRVG